MPKEQDSQQFLYKLEDFEPLPSPRILTRTQMLNDLKVLQYITSEEQEREKLRLEEGLTQKNLDELATRLYEGVSISSPSGEIVSPKSRNTDTDFIYHFEPNFPDRVRHTYLNNQILEFYLLKPTKRGNVTTRMWGYLHAAARFLDNRFADGGLGLERKNSSIDLVKGLMLEITEGPSYHLPKKKKSR